MAFIRDTIKPRKTTSTVVSKFFSYYFKGIVGGGKSGTVIYVFQKVFDGTMEWLLCGITLALESYMHNLYLISK